MAPFLSPTLLSSIGGVRLIPDFGVAGHLSQQDVTEADRRPNLQRTVLSLRIAGRVQVQDVSIEEVADLWWASILGRMSYIILCLRVAVSSAKGGIKSTSSEDGCSHIRVVALAIIGSIDGSVLRNTSERETVRNLQVGVLVSV